MHQHLIQRHWNGPKPSLIMNHYSVAYAGERITIEAISPTHAETMAQLDYRKPPCDRVEDWKESEHTEETWDVIKL